MTCSSPVASTIGLADAQQDVTIRTRVATAIEEVHRAQQR